MAPSQLKILSGDNMDDDQEPWARANEEELWLAEQEQASDQV